jgi:hypothetical protein
MAATAAGYRPFATGLPVGLSANLTLPPQHRLDSLNSFPGRLTATSILRRFAAFYQLGAHGASFAVGGALNGKLGALAAMVKMDRGYRAIR